MSDPHTYTPLARLQTLTLAELEALWDAVPTEDRDALERRYQHKVAAIRDDPGEIQLIETYLQRYQYEGLVPAGKQWLRISPARRQEYERDPLASVDDASAEGGIPRILWLLGGAVLLFMLAFILTNLPGGAEAVDVDLSPTPTATVTLTPSPTPTQTPIPTSTPLALVESDPFIEAGERGNRRLYPVQFQVHPDADAVPRVFIVQERAIETTEWHFDPNPDVVSWLSGTHIRPIIGIPYSESNLALLDNLDDETTFVLRMNTGLEIRFQFEQAASIARQETAHLQQNRPGVVLLLIGERDASGLPTARRSVVLGRYTVDLPPAGAGGRPARIGDTVSLDPLQVRVQSTALHAIADDPIYHYALIDVAITNPAATPQALTLADWRLVADAGRYAPDLVAHRTLERPPLPATVPAGETVTGTLIYLVARFTTDVRLDLDGQPVILSFDPPPQAVTPQQLAIDLRAVTHHSDTLQVTARLYNPLAEPITLDSANVSIVYGFSDDPRGPTVAAHDFTAITIPADAAHDAQFVFPWNGADPVARLQLAGYHYRLRLRE